MIHHEANRSSLLEINFTKRKRDRGLKQDVTNLPAFFRMFISLMAVFWCALFSFLKHPKEVFGEKLDRGRACKDNREEFGFALVGHDFRSLHADNFARCYLECSLEDNLVPRVLSLPRESTLVAAGHVSMYTNQIRRGGGSLT